MSKLISIPGVGKQTDKDLIRLGYRTVESLKGQNPEEIYKKDCELKGKKIDKCQLYIYRCAVYFASTKDPDPDKLKWWNWKD